MARWVALVAALFSLAAAAQQEHGPWLEIVRVGSDGVEAGNTPASSQDRALRVRLREGEAGQEFSLEVVQPQRTRALAMPAHARIRLHAAGAVDLPIRRGREGKAKLILRTRTATEPLAEYGVSVVSKPVVVPYGEDGPSTLDSDDTLGVLGAQEDRPDAPRFFVRLVPKPVDGRTCDVTLSNVGKDGTVFSLVRTVLKPPAYQAGPFLALAARGVFGPGTPSDDEHGIYGDPSEQATDRPQRPGVLLVVGTITFSEPRCR